MTLAQLRILAHARSGLPAPDERRAIRERAAVSQVELAAAIGITSSAISLYESGQRTPRGATREAYLDALRILRKAGDGTPE